MFYEHLNREPVTATKRRAVRELLAENKAKKNIITTSVITDLEVLPEKLAPEHADKEAAYRGQFDGVHMVSVEISSNVLMLAREIRGRYYRPPPEGGGYAKMMDLGDAIHLATAALLGVDAFHTRDDTDEKTKIPLVSLYEWAGEDRLCGRYDLKIVSPESDQGELDDIP
ncbi:MAG TPA: PIN domain-containing protein [Allosphingosinicella sp.]|jgi:hypothetical protein|nr:PIN domain-containing protein [Allosphingosinicella sp.]